MASNEGNEAINTEKTFDGSLENFQPVTEQPFVSSSLVQQQGEPVSSYNVPEGSESAKDNDQSPGMSFQILSNFILYVSFCHLWNRRIEILTVPLNRNFLK